MRKIVIAYLAATLTLCSVSRSQAFMDNTAIGFSFVAGAYASWQIQGYLNSLKEEQKNLHNKMRLAMKARDDKAVKDLSRQIRTISFKRASARLGQMASLLPGVSMFAHKADQDEKLNKAIADYTAKHAAEKQEEAQANKQREERELALTRAFEENIAFHRGYAQTLETMLEDNDLDTFFDNKTATLTLATTPELLTLIEEEKEEALKVAAKLKRAIGKFKKACDECSPDDIMAILQDGLTQETSTIKLPITKKRNNAKKYEIRLEERIEREKSFFEALALLFRAYQNQLETDLTKANDKRDQSFTMSSDNQDLVDDAQEKLPEDLQERFETLCTMVCDAVAIAKMNDLVAQRESARTADLKSDLGKANEAISNLNFLTRGEKKAAKGAFAATSPDRRAAIAQRKENRKQKSALSPIVFDDPAGETSDLDDSGTSAA